MMLAFGGGGQFAGKEPPRPLGVAMWETLCDSEATCGGHRQAKSIPLMTLALPSSINSNGIFPFLAQLASVENEESIELDFAELRRVSPGALVGLVATVTRWMRQGKQVFFLNLNQCAITGYLQRMDVLRTCGIDVPESFTRHESRGRFVPVQPVRPDVEKLGHDLAACLAPGGDDYEHPMASLYDLSWYVFTETANNARQHSRGLGYVAAQVARQEGLLRLAVADNGKGIRQSFIEAGLPWADGLSDGPAILKALDAKISSKGSPANEGVGMTLISSLVKQSNGWLLVVSGAGVVRLEPGKEPLVQCLPLEARYEGTLVVTAFRQKEVTDFASLLHEAKMQNGLLPNRGITGSFQP